ncbi:cyclic nucleotide-binding domain-containing protein [Arcticibacter eurypsychrophilus]|uniref:hypothetical protein n=1 Tax=Arcticibacter eurypsychrophilus TaxID=1434752 RepID=UPI00147DEED5|nr:hypothetical protein [Arcticibacter eurypsychrophilus]
MKLHLFPAILMRKYSSQASKDNDFLHFGTAKERYDQFVKRYPDLALSVPLQCIASYLRITPQSFSRIRKEAVR